MIFYQLFSLVSFVTPSPGVPQAPDARPRSTVWFAYSDLTSRGSVRHHRVLAVATADLHP